MGTGSGEGAPTLHGNFASCWGLSLLCTLPTLSSAGVVEKLTELGQTMPPGKGQAGEARPSTHRHTTYSLGMPPPAINAKRPSCPQPVQAAWQTVRGIHKQAWMKERWFKRLRPAETHLLPRRRKQARGANQERQRRRDFKIGAPWPTQVDLTFCGHIFIDRLFCSSTYFFPIS